MVLHLIEVSTILRFYKIGWVEVPPKCKRYTVLGCCNSMRILFSNDLLSPKAQAKKSPAFAGLFWLGIYPAPKRRVMSMPKLLVRSNVPVNIMLLPRPPALSDLKSRASNKLSTNPPTQKAVAAGQIKSVCLMSRRHFIEFAID